MDNAFFLLLTFFSVENIYASKILLLPYGDKVTSHHTRMIKIGTYLHENGHQVSMVMPSTASHLLKNSTLKLYEFQLPNDHRLNNGLSIMKQMSILKLHQVVSRVVSHTKRICYYFFSSTVALELKQVGFDLVIVDTASSCMKLLADYLNTTIVQYSSWGFFGDHSFFIQIFLRWCAHQNFNVFALVIGHLSAFDFNGLCTTYFSISSSLEWMPITKK